LGVYGADVDDEEKAEGAMDVPLPDDRDSLLLDDDDVLMLENLDTRGDISLS
jgi:hypothetical protein